MADLAILAEVLELFPEGTRQRAALTEAIADSRRLDKVDRMQIDIMTEALTEHEGFYAIAAGGAEGDGLTVREAIDGVPGE